MAAAAPPPFSVLHGHVPSLEHPLSFKLSLSVQKRRIMCGDITNTLPHQLQPFPTHHYCAFQLLAHCRQVALQIRAALNFVVNMLFHFTRPAEPAETVPCLTFLSIPP